MEVPFKLTDKTTGEPITDLVKYDVVLKMSDAPYTIMPYTDLGTIGSEYGEYVLIGVNFFPTSCKLYIKNVAQDDWFGTQILGDLDLLYTKKAEFGSVTGNLNSSITSLQTATGVLNSALVNKAGLTSNNYYTGENTFSGNSTFTGEVIVPTTQLWYHPAQKIYVDSQIQYLHEQITSYVGDAYQESPNIKRLIINGSATGSVYTTWVDALASCYGATNNHQYTILISGEGTNASYINMGLTAGKGFYDYVHMKGLGSGITVNAAGNVSLSATDNTRTIIEDLTFILNDSENPFEFKNLTIKNCKFIEIDSTGVVFANCNFEGVNSFSSLVSTIQFTNCIGNPIYTTSNITVNGTNLIDYNKPKEINLGLVKLSATGGNLEVNSSASFQTNISTPFIILGSQNIQESGGATQFNGPVWGGAYWAADGTAGVTTNAEFRDADGGTQTITIKNGLITNLVKS